MDSAYSSLVIQCFFLGKIVLAAGFFINIQKFYYLVFGLIILTDKGLSIICLLELLKWNKSLYLIESFLRHGSWVKNKEIYFKQYHSM